MLIPQRTLWWVAGVATLVTWTLAAAGGCTATKDDPFDDDDDGATGGTAGTTATGGGGTGGTTTTTNTSMCDIDCSTINTPDCQVSVCNEGQHRGTVGVCVVVPDEDGTPCDDGEFCTVQDACVDGVCVGGPENDCGMTPGQCMEVYCDENSQTCGEQASPPGAACQDPNDLCLKGGTCTNGLCTGGAPEDCFFFPVPDDCHVAECNPQTGQCEPVPGNEGLACVDINDLCTPGKTCASGVCQGGAPLDCTYLTQGCTLGLCDTNTGTCTTQTLNNGQPCDDLNACTNGETCQNNSCSNGTPVTTCSQTGDGCCPNNCTASNDIDCTVQPNCLAIKTSVPASTDGIYTVDPDLSGPIQQMQVYCDMTTDQGGWTLVARFANIDARNWMEDSGEWWYTRVTPSGLPTVPTDNADMYSVAFHTVQGAEFKLSRTDQGHGHLLRTINGCLPNTNFRTFITSFGNFQNSAVWAADAVLGTCNATLGGAYATTNGFQYATCTGDIGAPNAISFWADWSSGDGAVMMIGGGGTNCARADHGIGITEANAACFSFTTSEDDFGYNGSDTANGDNYALNLWVR